MYLPGLVNFKDGALVVLPGTEVVLTTVSERPVGNFINIATSDAVEVGGSTS